MKRKILAVLLAAITTVLCGCSADNNTADSEEKLTIITTIFPAYDFARQVFGENADVKMLLKPGQESHSYDPSAKDIVEISSSDLFIYNGGESDQWVESILESTPDISIFRMTDAVSLLEEETAEGMQTDEHNHDEDTEYDEHIWTSPQNAAVIVRALGEYAAEIFPEISEELSTNASDYADKIDSLDRDFSELLYGEERYFIFGDRFPMLYFFKEYGLNYYAAFPGCGSETEPSAKTMTFLLEKLCEPDAVPAVFCIELSSRRLAGVLAEDSGLETEELHACHNISQEDFQNGETWLSLMQRNYETLSRILE